MEKLHYETRINAPAEKVWKTMLADDTYRQWTSAFAEGSYYEGSWEKGSKILFLDPEGCGMVAEIVENRPYEFISIKHLGLISNGAEDTESQEIETWDPAFENYTFEEKNGRTTLKVDMDIDEEHEEMFNVMWPRALRILRKITER